MQVLAQFFVKTGLAQVALIQRTLVRAVFPVDSRPQKPLQDLFGHILEMHTRCPTKLYPDRLNKSDCQQLLVHSLNRRIPATAIRTNLN